MIPHHLTFSGFGPHSHTEIKFSDLGPSVALCAQFGTGKTFILEAILFALYGKGAWYGDMYDAMTTNGTGKAEVYFAFSINGERYGVERELRVTEKTKSHKAKLFKFNPDELIAGPKSSDVNDKIEALVGSFDEIIGTRFLAQNRHGDLVATPGIKDLAALRRSIVFGMLDLDYLDKLSARISDEAKGDDRLARELEAQLAGEPDPAEAIANAERELDQACVSKAKIETDLAAAEQSLAAAKSALDKANAGTETHKAAIERYTNAKKRADELEKSLSASNRRIESLKAIADTIPELQKQIEKINNLKFNRDELYKQQHAFETYTEWTRRRDELDSKIATQRSTIDTLEAVPGCDAATVTLAGTVADVLADYRKAEMENNERTNRMNRRATERTGFQRELDKATAEISRLELKLSEAPELPNDCTECPIGKSVAAEVRSIPQRITELNATADGYRTQIAASMNIDTLEPPAHNLDEIRERGQRARDAESAVNNAKTTTGKLTQARAELIKLEDASTTHAITQPDAAQDPAADLERVRKDLEDLGGVGEKLLQANRAKEDLAEECVIQARLIDDYNDASMRVTELAQPADDAQKALDDLDKELDTLTVLHISANEHLKWCKDRHHKSISSIASTESALANLRERATQTAEKRARLESIRDRVEGLRDLQVCFGPKGARQILIDSIAPQISDIADALFDVATEGQMRLRIATQRATEKGVTECFDILVRDHRGERPVPDGYSGGQLQLIRIVFRISMALWVGKLYGRKPDWLILDEAFDALGREGSDQLLRVIDHLRDQFPFMLVVTHDPAIASRFPGQIYLTPRFGGVTVNTVSTRKEQAA